MSTTAVSAIVRPYAPSFTHTHPLSSASLLPFLNETSFSTRLTTETLPPSLCTRCQTAYQPLSLSHLVFVSELFRIIIFVSERHPRDSKLKLSFLAFTRKGERERERKRGKECVGQKETNGYEDGEIVRQERWERFLSRLSATSRLRFSIAAS